MHAHAAAHYVLGGSVPSAPTGRHAKIADSSQTAEPSFRQPSPAEPAEPAEEDDFDSGRPFVVDIGRAAIIAEYLRESGYPLCTAEVVTEELAKPERERSGVGHFAVDQLKRAGWRP